MSFGKPGKYGKFYAGRQDDTPVNHDLLWRRRVTSEVELLKAQQSAQSAQRAAWTHREEQDLVSAYARHGVGNYEAIKRDPEYKILMSTRGKLGLHAKWKQLSQGGLAVDDVQDKLRSEREAKVYGPKGHTARLRDELKLKERVQRHKQRTARKEEKLATMRRKRFAAEKRAAAEMRKTRQLQDALAALERQVAEEQRSSGRQGRRQARRRPRLGKSMSDSLVLGPASPIRAGGAHVMNGAGKALVPSPTISTVATSNVPVGTADGRRRRREMAQFNATQHAQRISYLCT